jgi:hypothetical protein
VAASPPIKSDNNARSCQMHQSSSGICFLGDDHARCCMLALLLYFLFLLSWLWSLLSLCCCYWCSCECCWCCCCCCCCWCCWWWGLFLFIFVIVVVEFTLSLLNLFFLLLTSLPSLRLCPLLCMWMFLLLFKRRSCDRQLLLQLTF